MFPALPCAQEGAGALRSKASPGRRVLLLAGIPAV